MDFLNHHRWESKLVQLSRGNLVIISKVLTVYLPSFSPKGERLKMTHGRLYFLKMEAAIDPISHALLARWCWHSSTERWGLFPPLEPGQTNRIQCKPRHVTPKTSCHPGAWTAHAVGSSLLLWGRWALRGPCGVDWGPSPRPAPHANSTSEGLETILQAPGNCRPRGPRWELPSWLLLKFPTNRNRRKKVNFYCSVNCISGQFVIQPYLIHNLYVHQ